MALFYLNNAPQATVQQGIRKGTKVPADLHADYIMREGRYKKYGRTYEDLEYKEVGGIPSWGKTPRRFFRTADRLCQAFLGKNF